MDYKAVIEEQIRELQKLQDTVVKNGVPEQACTIAHTITDLCGEAKHYPG